MRWSLFVILVITACSHLTTGIDDSADLVVASYETIDPEPLNLKIESAIKKGENWPSSPALIAVTLLGNDDESQFYSLKEEKNKSENPDDVVIVMVREGFLDDSVRGDWHRLVLVGAPDSTWRVDKLDRAWRCWRSDKDGYQSGECP